MVAAVLSGERTELLAVLGRGERWETNASPIPGTTELGGSWSTCAAVMKGGHQQIPATPRLLCVPRTFLHTSLLGQNLCPKLFHHGGQGGTVRGGTCQIWAWSLGLDCSIQVCTGEGRGRRKQRESPVPCAPIKPGAANFEVAAVLCVLFPGASIYEKGIFSGGKFNTEQENDEGISEVYRPVVAPLLSEH